MRRTTEERSTTMIDRTQLDLRFNAHARMARATDGNGWKDTVVLPLPCPRAALATALLRLAARLDAPATFAQRQDTALAPATVPTHQAYCGLDPAPSTGQV